MNRSQIFAAGLSTLKEMGLIDYKKSNPNENVIGTRVIWEKYTSDLSDTELQAGFDGLIANTTSDFNKKILPGDLRKYINKQTAINHGEMFAEIIAKGPHVKLPLFNRAAGHGIAPIWSSSVIPKAIEQMGGLDAFLLLPLDQENTFRAQFREVVNAINEKEQNAPIMKPALDARAALAESSRPQPKAIEAPKEELQLERIQDQRVLDGFAALKANFQTKGIVKQAARVNAMKSAAENMKNALEMMP